MKLAIATLCFAILALLPGCGGDGNDNDTEEDLVEGEKPDPPGHIPNTLPVTTSNLVCPSGTTLNYENFGEAFLLDHCTTCHNRALPDGQRAGAPLGIDFDQPGDSILWRANMLARAGKADGTMPPVNTVEQTDRELFALWLNCGAPSGNQRIK